MSPLDYVDFIRLIHDSGRRAVIAATGGGSRGVADLLAVGGASRTIVEAVVPYAPEALEAWLGGRPEQFCSSITARRMASAALRRCAALQPAEASSRADRHPAPLVGLGLTASLASDRPKLGPHRIHLAAQTASATRSWDLELRKGARSREEEEAVAARLLVELLGAACELDGAPRLPLVDDEAVVRRRTEALPSWIELQTGRIDKTSERRGYVPRPEAPRGVFPGSFRPLHDGHRRMMQLAAERLGGPIDVEISIENVEKPALDFEDMRTRGDQFGDDVRVWYTRAPRMVQKARLFPGCTIVCGIDTLARVADVRFAGGDPTERDRVIEEIAALGCRFLVFGRQTASGFETAADLDLPPTLRALCDAVSEAEFRADVSSTALRKQTVGDTDA